LRKTPHEILQGNGETERLPVDGLQVPGHGTEKQSEGMPHSERDKRDCRSGEQDEAWIAKRL